MRGRRLGVSDDISTWIGDLSAEEPARRRRAAERLARSGTGARGAAVPLVRAAGDRSEEVREWATAALEGLGPPDVADLAALRELLTRPRHPDCAYWATTLIGRLGAGGQPAVPELVSALQNTPQRSVRQRAAWALGKIGPPAAAARGALEEATRSGDARLARLAERALQEIG